MSNDILSTIDRAIGCQTCEGDLTGSVSDDFCSERCQARWHARRVEATPDSPNSDLAGWLPIAGEVYRAPVGTPLPAGGNWSRFGTIGAVFTASLDAAVRRATVASTHFVINADGTMEQLRPLDAPENGNNLL